MDAHRKAIIHGSGQSRWRTTPAMAQQLVTLFYCAIDLAAEAESSVCGAVHYLGPGSRWAEDALAVSWYDMAAQLGVAPIGFLNPPFSLSEIRELKLSGVPADDPQLRALRSENWAQKAYEESLAGFTTIGVFPYSPQTEWFRTYVMGHELQATDGEDLIGFSGHAALDYWRIPHRVSYLQPDGSPSNNAGVNTCVIQWGPNPGFVGPWVPSGRYWSYR